MKNYSRVLGITSLVISLFAISIIIIGKFQNKIDWLTLFILLIPISVIVNYLVVSKFGFNISNNRQPFYVISSILVMVFLMIIPVLLYLLDLNNKVIIEENEKKAQMELLEQIEGLKTPIDLGKDTTVYDIECLLKTRYSNQSIEYIFNATYLENERPNIDAFLIALKDSSGFIVTEIDIDSWTRIVDPKSKKPIGFRKNSKLELTDFREYQRIKSFDVSVRTVK